MSLKLRVRNNYRKGGIAALAIAGALVAAFALVPTSGAWFFDAKTGAAVVSTQTLGLRLDGGAQQLDLAFDDLLPGDSRNDTFTIENTGTTLGRVMLELGHSDSGLIESSANLLHYYFSTGQTTLAFGPNGGTADLGWLAPGETRTIPYGVMLEETAGNDWQNVRVSSPVTLTMTQDHQ